MDLDLKNIVQKALVWNAIDWETALPSIPGLKRLVNSLKYWFPRLSPALKQNNVIVTLFQPGRHTYVSLDKIIDSILAFDASITIAGYAKFQNKRYLSLSFQNAEIKKKVVENLKFVQGDYVVHLNWADIPTFNVNLRWLSNEVDLLQVINYLQKYIEVTSIHRVETILKNGMIIPSGYIMAKGVLQPNCLLVDIPQLDYIDDMQVLISVTGRPPLCFGCLGQGHIAKNCPKFYCFTCHLTHPFGLSCQNLSPPEQSRVVPLVHTAVQPCLEDAPSLTLEGISPVETSSASTDFRLPPPLQAIQGNLKVDSPQQAGKGKSFVSSALRVSGRECRRVDPLLSAVPSSSTLFPITDLSADTLDVNFLDDSSDNEDSLLALRDNITQYNQLVRLLPDFQNILPTLIPSSGIGFHETCTKSPHTSNIPIPVSHVQIAEPSALLLQQEKDKCKLRKHKFKKKKGS